MHRVYCRSRLRLGSQAHCAKMDYTDMRGVFMGVVAASVAALSLPASAQQTLDVQSAVALALRTHPLLAAGADRIAAARGLQQQAALRPNPIAILQTENWRSGGEPAFAASEDTDTFAYLSQVIETAGKRRNRTRVAAAEAERAVLERELLAKQIAARVKAAYWNAAGAQRLYELLMKNVATYDQIVRYHEDRVREGAMAEADLIKVTLERERVAIAANSALLDAERARIQLYREMGQVNFPQVRFTEPLDPPPLPVVNDEEALANRTEVKIASQALRTAQANADLQRSLGAPNVDVYAGFKRTAGLNTAMGGVQIPLPFGNRNQGNIAASLAGIRTAESELAAAKAMVIAEVHSALREAEMRREQAVDYLPEMMRRAEESSRISLAAYREGGADLLRLLDTERVRIETQMLYYRTLAEYRQSLAALETAMGVAP
jgi:cobalt-zinc-cadmium efflux system outer membrane protein